MTTLSEIEAAVDNLQLRSELTMQWSQDRGFGDHPICVHAHMRYIERLEARLAESKNVIMDLSRGIACVLRFYGSSEEYIAGRLKQAHDLLVQHEGEGP